MHKHRSQTICEISQMRRKLSKLLDLIGRRVRGMCAAGGSASFSLAKYAVRDRLPASTSHGLVTMRSNRVNHPLAARSHTSDGQVFYQVFARLEYSCVDDMSGVSLIIDCGANVGYSSAYFLSRFPNVKLIAVEPDPGNFKILQRNLEPFGPRVKLIQSGIWSHSCGLVISKERYADGREWAIQVRETKPGETPQMTAVDIETLLRESGESRISILKIDIERAEAIVFASNFESWIDKVDNLVIELHDEECQRIFLKAIEGQGFGISHSGELTVCRHSNGTPSSSNAPIAH